MKSENADYMPTSRAIIKISIEVSLIQCSWEGTHSMQNCLG